MKKLEKLNDKKINFGGLVMGGVAGNTTTAHSPTNTSGHVACDHKQDMRLKDGSVVILNG